MSPSLDSEAHVAEVNANTVSQGSLKHTSLVLKIQNKAVVALLQNGTKPGNHTW